MTLATFSRSDIEPERQTRLTPDNVTDLARNYPFSVRKALAFGARLQCGRLLVQMPDGARFALGQGAGLCADVEVRNLAFAKKMALGGDIGFAESFIDGDWTTTDLACFLELFGLNRENVVNDLKGRPIVRLVRRLRHRLRRNSRLGARRNIHAHYDLGNEFYGAWLDETMTYSAAMFEGGARDLEHAQLRKYRALAELAELTPNSRLLEIGCGWGGFAVYAAQTYGCRVTALTISERQFEFAKRQVFEHGLADRVTVKLQDYRDEVEVYDRIASIEMIEAVGEAYWPIWFKQVRDRLRAGGRAAVQAITISEQAFPRYRREVDFIRRYIFPGGMLPTARILREMSERHGLSVVSERAFGQDYGHTIAQWRSRFRSAWPQLIQLGFDERFRRLWEYYFAYCEAGFRVGTIDVRQMAIVKES